MKLRTAMGLAAISVCFTVSMAGQTSVEQLVVPPPAPIGMMGGVVSLGAYNMRAVKGQPYSMVEKTTTVKTLADGTTITNTNEQRVMRDSEGRERREMGVMKDGQLKVMTVFLTNPSERFTASLFAFDKSAHVRHVPEPRPQTPEQQAHADEMRAKAEAYRKEHPTTPNSETLPPRTIAGVYVEGVHQTLIIPAGRMGNDRDIHVEQETWTSPDLKVAMLSKTDDPRMGKITREVTSLERVEPDAALFQIPPDYKLVEDK